MFVWIDSYQEETRICLIFEEKILNNESKQELMKISRWGLYDKSMLKIVKSHSISFIIGFQEHSLNQLIEHIEKYKPKINQ